VQQTQRHTVAATCLVQPCDALALFASRACRCCCHASTTCTEQHAQLHCACFRRGTRTLKHVLSPEPYHIQCAPIIPPCVNSHNCNPSGADITEPLQADHVAAAPDMADVSLAATAGRWAHAGACWLTCW
jgi:hypothetical protein